MPEWFTGGVSGRAFLLSPGTFEVLRRVAILKKKATPSSILRRKAGGDMRQGFLTVSPIFGAPEPLNVPTAEVASTLVIVS